MVTLILLITNFLYVLGTWDNLLDKKNFIYSHIPEIFLFLCFHSVSYRKSPCWDHKIAEYLGQFYSWTNGSVVDHLHHRDLILTSLQFFSSPGHCSIWTKSLLEILCIFIPSSFFQRGRGKNRKIFSELFILFIILSPHIFFYFFFHQGGGKKWNFSFNFYIHPPPPPPTTLKRSTMQGKHDWLLFIYLRMVDST